MGPRAGQLKITKLTSDLEKKTRTFRRARIDPSRQGVMNERSFNEGDINFWPKHDEKVQKQLQTTKNPIPPSIHPALFFLQGGFLFSLKGAPHWYQHTLGLWYYGCSLLDESQCNAR